MRPPLEEIGQLVGGGAHVHLLHPLLHFGQDLVPIPERELLLAARDRAGVGTLGIVDDDEVDLTNLQRQVIHNSEA